MELRLRGVEQLGQVRLGFSKPTGKSVFISLKMTR